jgi:hypothetical protein
VAAEPAWRVSKASFGTDAEERVAGVSLDAERLIADGGRPHHLRPLAWYPRLHNASRNSGRAGKSPAAATASTGRRWMRI